MSDYTDRVKKLTVVSDMPQEILMVPKELEINEDDLEDYDSMDDMSNPITQKLMGNQPSKSDDSDAKVNVSASKREEQQSTIAKRGTKPSGFGKESKFNNYPYIIS